MPGRGNSPSSGGQMGADDAARILQRDFERLGIPYIGRPIRGTGPETPRARAHPPSGPTQGIPGVGDLHQQDSEPGNNYWTQWRQERARPLEQPVQAPMPQIPQQMQDLYRVFDRALREHESRKNDLCQCVTKPAWIEPPLTSTCLDLFTDVAVTLPAGSINGGVTPGTLTNLISFNVPDRHIAVFDRMGMQLGDHLSFGNVRFSVRRNDTPLKCYGGFRPQLGEFTNPTKMANPIILKYADQFRVAAQSLDTNEHTAWFRMTGWLISVTELTSMGSYAEMPQK